MLDKLDTADRQLADIADRLTRIIRRQTGPIQAFSVTSRLREDLALDSIHMMSIACEVEEEFDVVLSDDAIDGASTVQSLVDAVAAEIEEREADRERRR